TPLRAPIDSLLRRARSETRPKHHRRAVRRGGVSRQGGKSDGDVDEIASGSATLLDRRLRLSPVGGAGLFLTSRTIAPCTGRTRRASTRASWPSSGPCSSRSSS